MTIAPRYVQNGIHGRLLGLTADEELLIQSGTIVSPDGKPLSFPDGFNGLNYLGGPQLAAGAFPGGPQSSNSIAATNGTLNVWNQQTYGWGGTACGATIIVGESYPGPDVTAGQAPVGGGIGVGSADPPSGYARYPLREAVGICVYNRATTAYIGGAKIGTFTATQFFPAVPYTAAQVAKFRYQMPVDTNDSPEPCSGVLMSWASDGSSITVSNWYAQGDPTIPGIPVLPVGTAATVGNVSKIYGANIVSERDSGCTATQNVCLELDPINSTGVDDTGADVSGTTYDGGLHIPNLGRNRISFGILTQGDFVSQITLQGDSTNGITVSPSANHAVTYAFHAFGTGVSIAFFSQTAQEAVRVATTDGDITARILSTGNAEWGEQTTAAGNNTQSFFTSASGAGKPDATWTYSGGTGNNDGVAALSAGALKLPTLVNAANDGAAASAGVALGQVYRNGSALMARVA